MDSAIKYINELLNNPSKWITTSVNNNIIVPTLTIDKILNPISPWMFGLWFADGSGQYNSKEEPLPTNTNLAKIIEKAGYKDGTGAYEMALAIGTKEGWYKGTRSFRNNNPGNLDYSNNLKSIDSGVTMESNGNSRFAKFSTAELGVKALVENKIKRWANGNMPITSGNQSQLPGGYKKGTQPTIKQFFYTYAPPSENNTQLYISQVINALNKNGFNIGENSKVIDILR